MGEARRRRLAYQRQHKGPVPPPMPVAKTRDLHVVVPVKFAELLEARYEVYEKETNPEERQTFGEFVAQRLLDGLATYDYLREKKSKEESLILQPTDAQVRKVVNG